MGKPTCIFDNAAFVFPAFDITPEVPESSGGDNWFVEHQEGGLRCG